jgi:hypothetical protein
MALKTKKAKTASHRPPSEIRDNTKLRRAWLAEKLAEISAKPNTEAKIVGVGSYQEVSEWTVTQVEGRLRHRGVCQVCGREQVVDETTGKLVLHGYKRPGYGSIHSECPGIGELSLNVSDKITQDILRSLQLQQRAGEKEMVLLEEIYDKMSRAKHPRSGKQIEDGAWADIPEKRPVRGGKYTSEALEAAKWDRAAMIVWANEWPITAAYRTAQRARDEHRSHMYRLASGISFYTDLLARKITGTPLREEVVV